MDVVYVGRSGNVFKTFPAHRHGYWEIILNIQGKGTMTVEGQRCGFEPGDIAVIPPGIGHQKDSGDGFSDMCMFIRDFRPVGKEGFRILQDDSDGTVRHLMEMAGKFSGGDSIYEHAILNVIGDLLYQVLVLFYINNQQKDLRLEGLMELMQNNLDNAQFDLSAAIEASGYCKGYFRKIFKDFYGEPPVEYFQKMRINYAKSLLSQYGHSRSVKDVANSSGFKDPLYFSRVFKKLEGISPREYVAQQRLHDSGLIVMDTPEEFRKTFE